MFKVGDSVKFKGITVGAVVLKPRQGTLRLNDRNTTIKGVMSLIGDRDHLMFLPDGTIYCHSHLGVLLESIPKTEADSLLKKLED